MAPLEWDGAELLRDASWTPADPDSAHSARFLAERLDRLSLVASVAVRDPWARPSRVMIAHDPRVRPPEPQFLAVAAYTDRIQRLFEMSHHLAVDTHDAQEWLSRHHTARQLLMPSLDVTRAARLVTVLQPRPAIPTLPPTLAQPSRPATTPRSIGR